MEGMVAYAPGNSALFARSRGLVCLTLDTEVHDVIAADGTVVDNDVPCPESNGVPLLDLELLLLDDLSLLSRGITHLNIGHGSGSVSLVLWLAG